MKRSILILFVILTACHSKRHPISALPPTPPPPEVVTVEAPIPKPVETPPDSKPAPPVAVAPPERVPEPIELADAAFTAGNYQQAARLYEGILQKEKSAEDRDQILFNLALCYALTPNTNPDWNSITVILKQIVEQYPLSPLKAQATVMLNLATDSQKREQRVKQLTSEIDKLKQIDAQRRKRP